MPFYCFKCPACGARQEVFREVKDYKKQLKCKCNEVMERDLRAEHGFVSEQHSPGNWPMVSDMAGVAPSQVGELRQTLKTKGLNTEVREDGSVVWRSRGERKAYCEAVGLYDRNAGYSDPQRRNG